MTARVEVAAHERGVLRVFAVDLSPKEARGFLRAFDEGGPEILAEALGVPGLNPDYVELFASEDIADLGLPAYLVDGYGVSDPALSSDADRLDALDGCIAVIVSAAFGGAAYDLTVREPLRLVATYREPPAVPAMDTLSAESAEGVVAGAAAEPPLKRGLSGWAVALICVVIAGVLVFLVGGGGGE
ncbi:MAG: hypothetical protein AAFO80_06025 [Pseudomonadota bacterium]